MNKNCLDTFAANDLIFCNRPLSTNNINNVYTQAEVLVFLGNKFDHLNISIIMI
jgi:hypothetical protein